MEESPCITDVENRLHTDDEKDRHTSHTQHPVAIVSESTVYNSKLCLTRSVIALGALLAFNLVITSLLSLDRFNQKAMLSTDATGELNIDGQEIMNMNKIQEEIDLLRLQIKKPEEETCFGKRLTPFL